MTAKSWSAALAAGSWSPDDSFESPSNDPGDSARHLVGCRRLHWIACAARRVFCLRAATVWQLLAAAGTKTSALQRWLIGWFGIRGIGSLYYLAYAQNSLSKHGDAGMTLAGITLSVVSLSILLHGTSATPLLALYERRSRAVSRRRSSGTEGSGGYTRDLARFWHR